jgi:hypothetical protein
MLEEYLPSLFDVLPVVGVVEKMAWPLPQLGQDLVQPPFELQELEEEEVVETSCEPVRYAPLKRPQSWQSLPWQMQLAMRILLR